jgi:hypothetical protein
MMFFYQAVERYFVDIWILDVIVLAVSGFATGIVLGLLMDLSRKKNWADKSSLFAISLGKLPFPFNFIKYTLFIVILKQLPCLFLEYSD